MEHALSGLHHVTAIAADPQRNFDFYTRFLGLRLVKQTVNFDSPDTYHFYYGDEEGRPGSLLTFFPFTNAAPGRAGAGMVDTTAFAIPETALDAWIDRLAGGVGDFDGPAARFGEQVLGFRDPDGLGIELVCDPALNGTEGSSRDQPLANAAIRRLHSVALRIEAPDRTARLLTETFGYEELGEEAGRVRFRARGHRGGDIVDLMSRPERAPGRMGAGTVHHVAFRARDAEEQRAWRDAIAALGFNVTPVLDRQYFTSIYFREPGGVLFEIATDPPGFAVDEAPDALGTALKLPPWLEPTRPDIERRLPPVGLSGVQPRRDA
ncbi:MAG TPA: ring-cleaving dioxygenase [Alphaproteobacteria bacterium]|nr:ring-cleaving dioxygenase [Alphaproteobacteria bacterium]